MNSRRSLVSLFAAGLLGFGLGVAVDPLRNTGLRKPLEARAVQLNPVVTEEPKLSLLPNPNSSAVRKMPSDLADAIRRRREGEYVRDSNIQSMRLQREEHVRRAADYNMALRDAEYRDLFDTLGLDLATSQQLRDHLRQIYEAKVDASRGLGEVLDANLEYDRRIKALLGENYSTYRAYEAAHPARREYSSFERYASGQGLMVPPAEKAHVEKLIQGTQAYSPGTEGDWGGPYTPMPQPVGGEALKPFLLSKLEALESSSKALLAQARVAGISEATLQSLEAYYRNEITSQQRQLAGVENPDLNRQIMLKKQLDRLRARSDVNPQLIERLESQLKSLPQERPSGAR